MIKLKKSRTQIPEILSGMNLLIKSACISWCNYSNYYRLPMVEGEQFHKKNRTLVLEIGFRPECKTFNPLIANKKWLIIKESDHASIF